MYRCKNLVPVRPVIYLQGPAGKQTPVFYFPDLNKENSLPENFLQKSPNAMERYLAKVGITPWKYMYPAGIRSLSHTAERHADIRGHE